MGKIAFIIPWYGPDIPGGSEAACRKLAEGLTKIGANVEVLTTCVKQFNSNWNENYYKPGVYEINGVLVKRFKVRRRDTVLFDRINLKLMNGQSISDEEETKFMEEMINSPDLYQYLRDKKQEYKAFIFIPYMFGTTYYGVDQVKNKGILLPAFHDESYAYMKIFKKRYADVRGMVFFSEPEKEWANKNIPISNVKQQVLGLGIEDSVSDPEAFREKFKITNPFILYAGRKDKGKNVHVLLDYFKKYKETSCNSLKLVLIGGGKIDIPFSVADDVIDLGFIDSQDKNNAYSAAEFLCNPSPNESFSFVIMESWNARRPVLVYEGCEVTKRFCELSNGGLYFNNYEVFKTCLNLLLDNSSLANKMGQNGRDFVDTNLRWDVILKAYMDFINECC